MKAKLRVMRGELRTRRGENAGLEISIRGRRFLIGSSTQCKLCCRSELISPQHCELGASDGVLWVVDLDSRTGTFVNDVRTFSKTRLSAGDRLRVGKLEFEVLIFAEDQAGARRDPMSEFVSDLLDEADEAERARRMADPATRDFTSVPSDSQKTRAPNPDGATTTETVARPTRRPPQKLPPAPELVADDSVEAAEETLKKILARLKGPKR